MKLFKPRCIKTNLSRDGLVVTADSAQKPHHLKLHPAISLRPFFREKRRGQVWFGVGKGKRKGRVEEIVVNVMFLVNKATLI